MKKRGVINSELSYLISKMGHTDKLVICDAGLPIPEDVRRIDLSLTRTIPKFMEVLEALLNELVIEKAILAEEIKDVSLRLHQEIIKTLGDIPVEYCKHEKFKQISSEARCIVRSGEVTPYANIILISGVDF